MMQHANLLRAGMLPSTASQVKCETAAWPRFLLCSVTAAECKR